MMSCPIFVFLPTGCVPLSGGLVSAIKLLFFLVIDLVVFCQKQTQMFYLLHKMNRTPFCAMNAVDIG